MIRINLLGTSRTKRGPGGRRPPTVTMLPTGEGPSSVILGLIVALIFGGACVGCYYYLDSESKKLDVELKKQEAENKRLSEVKRKYQESLTKKSLFEARVNVIHTLQEQQGGPTKMLNLVADTINNTDAVWLETMTNDGKNYDFVGVALNPNAVANLMVNLRKTGAFKTVEIKETSQDPLTKDVQTYKFELICEINKTDKKT